MQYCYTLAQYLAQHVFLCTQQETAAQEQSLSKARELECEDKVQSLVAEKSDLEATVDRLEKKIMQLEEICPSDIERLVKVYTFM